MREGFGEAVEHFAIVRGHFGILLAHSAILVEHFAIVREHFGVLCEHFCGAWALSVGVRGRLGIMLHLAGQVVRCGAGDKLACALQSCAGVACVVKAGDGAWGRRLHVTVRHVCSAPDCKGVQLKKGLHMSQVPSTPRPAVLAWCEAHIETFRTRAEEIGLQPDQGLTFATLTEAYATAAGELEKAKLAVSSKAEIANAAYTAMRRSMTNAVTDIRQFAEEQADPAAIYALADVPPRATPSQLPPPGRPSDFSVELLDTSGALQLRWKCVNPRGAVGTSYIIRRRLPGENAFTFIGVTGERRFVDNTFIAGPDNVSYTVQAQRADRAGLESPIYTINFGLQGPGRESTQQRQVKTTSEGGKKKVA